MRGRRLTATLAVGALLGCAVARDFTAALAPAAAQAAAWTTQPAQAPAHARDTALQAVACVSPTWCMAAGDGEAGRGFAGAQIAGAAGFTERWDGGAWTLTPGPALPAATTGLDAVSCVTRRFCVAVGAVGLNLTVGPSGGFSVSVGRGRTRAFAEVWNGTRWTVTPTPLSVATAHSSLTGVSCRSQRFCVAVGSGGGAPLAEQWNGSSWRLMSSPHLPRTRGSLLGVSCTTVSSCTAVGSFTVTPTTATTASHPLIERWSERRWTVEPAPYANGDAALSGVSCVSPAWCLAVGTRGRSDARRSVAETSDGSRWRRAGTGLPAFSPLYSVSCRSARFCLAVGQYRPRGGPGGATGPLAETWNGRRWSRNATQAASAPAAPGAAHARPAAYPELSGVWCVAQDACVAVGAQGTPAGLAPMVQADGAV